MPQRLILLTGRFEAQLLLPIFRRLGGTCDIEHVETLDRLAQAVSEQPGKARLVAFCTAVIVPARLLALMAGPSYNVHPGPPHYPGRHPESWGAYDGVTRFGATLHEMASRVDEGPIVDVEWAELGPAAGQIDIGIAAFRAALALVARWGPRLMEDARPLRHSGQHWSGRKTRQAEREAMCRISPDIDAVEFERRRRAFAEQPGSVMTMLLHGAEFRYTAPAPSAETRTPGEVLAGIVSAPQRQPS